MANENVFEPISTAKIKYTDETLGRNDNFPVANKL